MWAAHDGHSDVIKVLLEAGASIEAKDNVSKRISICTCVCVCVCVIFLHHSCKDRRITLTLMSPEVDQVNCSLAIPFSVTYCVAFSKGNYTYLV